LFYKFLCVMEKTINIGGQVVLNGKSDV